MKYFDRNTVKTSTNWHKKQFETDESRCNLKAKNLLKKKVRNFSYKIDDKLWWNALTEKEQIEAFREYYNNGKYWYSSYGSGGWSGYGTNILNMPTDEVISDEEHNRRIMELKEKFIPQTSRRRNLVIDDILK